MLLDVLISRHDLEASKTIMFLSVMVLLLSTFAVAMSPVEALMFSIRRGVVFLPYHSVAGTGESILSQSG